MGKIEGGVVTDKAPQYLFHQNEPLRLTDAYKQHIVYRSLYNGRRTTRYLRTKFENSPETNFETTFSKEHRLLILLDLAGRAANATRLMQSDRDEYGKFVTEAAHGNFPHDHNHGRRVKDHVEALILNSAEILPDKIPAYLIYATGLFSHHHDTDQLNTEKRNKDDKLSLLPKHAHGPAGAIHVLAQTQEYADAFHITYDQARKITGAAAIMMMKHEEPGEIAKALQGDKVLGPETDTQKLVASYDANELDLTQLTPSQLLKIVAAKKANSPGFVDEVKSPLGLHPKFEKEYEAELAKLAKDNLPMIPGYEPDRDLDALHKLTQICVFADVFDMIMPGQEAIVRKLGVQKSLDRDFFRVKDTEDQFFTDIVRENGHWEPEEGSDFTRVFWEFMHPLGGIESPLAHNPYVKELIKDAVIKGALTFLNVGTELMQGNIQPTIDKIYKQRIAALAEKILSNNDAPSIQVAGHDAMSVLQEHEAPIDRIIALLMEQEDLVQKLTKKLRTTPYTADNVKTFQTRAEKAITLLRETYKVSPEEFQRYKEELENGDFGMLPYSTYDSSRTMDDFYNGKGPKVIFSRN